MTAESTAGYEIPQTQVRFNRIASIFLILCGLNYTVYLYKVQWAIADGTPVEWYEAHEPNVLSFDGQYARLEPEEYGRLMAYRRISGSLLIVSFALRMILFLVNARLSGSKAADPRDELGPIRIASDGVAHVGGIQYPVLLPRGQVESLELLRTSPVERPGIAVVCGVVFLLFGLPLAVMIAPRIETLEMFAAFCLFAMLAGMGVWILWFALKKRFILVARTPTGQAQMIFHSAAPREQVIGFARAASLRHGYRFSLGRGL